MLGASRLRKIKSKCRSWPPSFCLPFFFFFTFDFLFSGVSLKNLSHVCDMVEVGASIGAVSRREPRRNINDAMVERFCLCMAAKDKKKEVGL